MVLITSTLGAVKNYPDFSMMQRTLGAFLNSLLRQTDPDWHLFISYHDKPPIEIADSRIHWCSIMCEPTCDLTAVIKKHPVKPSDPVEYEEVPYDGKMTDMSRKTYNSVIEAGCWAYQNNIREFWMLRMDSDDLLARDHMAKLHGFQIKDRDVKAVYSRICHMFDPYQQEIAIHRYPYSLTCNALLYELRDGEFHPDWYYHCDDHTRFMSRVKRERIPVVEVQFALCILTNTGNTISGRPEIKKEKGITLVPLTKELIDRYGLETLL